MSNKVLGIPLPTNEPDVAFDYFLDSIDEMLPIKDLCTILINFQPPWTEDLMNKFVNELTEKGFNVKYKFSKYQVEGKGLVPMCRIREETCQLDPDCLFYCLVDDDMRFRHPSPKMNANAGLQYLWTIDYLINNEDAGLVLFGGVMFRKVPKYHIGPVNLDSAYLTYRGMVFRSMGDKGLCVPNDAIDLVGSDEEKLIAGFRLNNGLYPSKFSNARVMHYEYHDKTSDGGTKNRTDTVASGTTTYEWDKQVILDKNVNKYIRENFNKEFGGKGHYNVVSNNKFINELNGIDVYNKEVVESRTTNYEGKSEEELVNSIKSSDLYKALKRL